MKQLPYAVDDETFPDIVREIQTMRVLAKASNVIHLIETLIVAEYDRQQLWLVMDYYDCGSLQDYLKLEKTPFAELVIGEIVRSAAHGLDAMHTANLVHRDLKVRRT